MIRVGLVGTGLAARVFHAPFLRAVPGLELTAVVQRTGEPVFPGVARVPSLEELLRHPVDLVVVATPNRTHVPLAREALEAGRHVVVDKPLAPSSAECAELERLAHQQGRILAPFHNRRWDGDFQTIVELVRSERLGRLVRLDSRFDRFRPQLKAGAWREDSSPENGILMDLGPHLIDQALALWGEPTAVTASVRTEREHGQEIEDSFDLELTYEGLRVRLGATMLAAEPLVRFRLHGTHGSYVKYGLDPQEARLKNGASIGANWGHEDEADWGTCYDAGSSERVPTLAGDYRGFYSNVAAAIRGEQQLAVTARDAVVVARIIELARQSSRERRTVQL